MTGTSKTRAGFLLSSALILGLAGCDADLRGGFGGAFDTSNAVRTETAPRPEPDTRGVISYPGYQVVVAGSSDTISSIAARLGLNASELARYNALEPDQVLRRGEIIALPRRVGESEIVRDGGSGLDVETIASNALDSIEPASHARNEPSTENLPNTGQEPIRHHVERGETAYSVARLYGVSVRSLAEWNSLGADMSVREGQYLLIPVIIEEPAVDRSAPGEGSIAPSPPSASQPLPDDDTAEDVQELDSPELAERENVNPNSVLIYPVSNGRIIRPFEGGEGSEGIDIAVAGGTPVVAAADGVVALITTNTRNVSLIMIRHADSLITVYAQVDNITVERGDSVIQGQQIAMVKDSQPSFLSFQTRRESTAIDPVTLLP